MINITVNKRKIPFGKKEVKLNGKKYSLHPFQEIFYSDLHKLPIVTAVTAPTGAGKTFAFMLPIIYAKSQNSVTPPRGLVIAPTNALVEDMNNTFKDIVKVEKVTGSTLQKHGIERPKELLEKVKSANIVVTNPDIVNFVIHGGYHTGSSGRRRHILNFQDWTEFFGKIDYIVVDEYHLYDEEQIANILVWLMTTEKFFDIKWFFISATPEPILLKILNEQRIEYEEIRQKLADSERSRVIQGIQKIQFIGVSRSNSLYKWLFNGDKIRDEVKDRIFKATKTGKKAFFLFNSLREAKMAENKMRRIFSKEKIGVNTGFETRQKYFNFDPEKYDIILTTSKAEVGVNYPVQLAYIDSGRYLRNFLQRVGRIGRGDKESEIYCITSVPVVENIKRYLKNNANVSYYEFIDVLNRSFEDLKLKEERIPVFVGALLWSVYIALGSYKRKSSISGLTEKFPYSKILFKLDAQIEKAKRNMDEDVYENLKIFWDSFKSSFRRFREDSIQWKVFYKSQETEYNIIWVLDNAFTEEINTDKKWIRISDFRPQREKIVKGILTPSLLDDPDAINNIQQIGGSDRRKEEWKAFLYSDHIGNLYSQKLEKWLECGVPKELANLLKKLIPLYSRKRIEIVDVLYDSIEAKEAFIF